MKMNFESRVYLQAVRSHFIKIEDEKIMAILENKGPITELNRTQMRAGLRSDGMPISPDYSEAYAWVKERMNTYKADPGVPDLFLTGEFQSKMNIVIGAAVYFMSEDVKAGDLRQRYGDSIFGLMTDNQRKAMIICTTTLLKQVYKALNNE